MAKDRMSEAEMLREARLRMGYSQQTVAAMIGVHIKQYQRFEYGERSIRNSSMKIGLAVCIVLDIDPYELVFGGELQSLGMPHEK